MSRTAMSRTVMKIGGVPTLLTKEGIPYIQPIPSIESSPEKSYSPEKCIGQSSATKKKSTPLKNSGPQPISLFRETSEENQLAEETSNLVGNQNVLAYSPARKRRSSSVCKPNIPPPPSCLKKSSCLISFNNRSPRGSVGRCNSGSSPDSVGSSGNGKRTLKGSRNFQLNREDATAFLEPLLAQYEVCREFDEGHKARLKLQHKFCDDGVELEGKWVWDD